MSVCWMAALQVAPKTDNQERPGAKLRSKRIAGCRGLRKTRGARGPCGERERATVPSCGGSSTRPSTAPHTPAAGHRASPEEAPKPQVRTVQPLLESCTSKRAYFEWCVLLNTLKTTRQAKQVQQVHRYAITCDV